MTIRRKASRYLNKFLNKYGYVFVRLANDDDLAGAGTEYAGGYAYENLSLLNTLAPWSSDQEFVRLHMLIKGNTLVDRYRCYELYQVVKEVANIPGDIVEVGVWRGGTGAILAAGAKRWKPEARVWLCDTFTGVVKAGARDDVYSGGEHADTSTEIVNELLARAGIDNVTILTGIFPDETAAAIETPNISFCHVDVDVYQSAADIVAWAKPRMLSGAFLVFDDYGFATCPGVTRIVDELRGTGDWIYIYNLNKHAILIKR